MSDAWTYRALTWAMPQCQGCEADGATVAVYEGRVWQCTLCAACAAVHQRDHAVQLSLFAREETA